MQIAVVLASAIAACQSPSSLNISTAQIPDVEEVSLIVESSPIQEISIVESPEAKETDEPCPVIPEKSREASLYRSPLFDFQFNYSRDEVVLDNDRMISADSAGFQGERIDIVTQADDEAVKAGGYGDFPEPPAYMSIRVTPFDESRFLEDWVQSLSIRGLPVENVKPTIMANQPALSTDIQGLYSLRHVVFASPDNRLIVDISVPLTRDGEIVEAYRATYEQVTDSFEFYFRAGEAVAAASPSAMYVPPVTYFSLFTNIG